MKSNYIILIGVLFMFVYSSCSKSDDNPVASVEAKLSDAKQIVSFGFLAAANSTLDTDISATINEASKIITATVPYGTDLTALLPSIEISDKASISQKSGLDFSSPVNFVVTAEDGSTATYSVVISVLPNSESLILRFDFRAEENGISADVIGEINQEEKVIALILPLDAEISALLPFIEVSPGAIVDIDGIRDFREPVNYSVTAENGSNTVYTIQVYYSQIEVLRSIYNANPNNTLDWNLSELDLQEWSGVELTEDGQIFDLTISNQNLTVIPSEIGKLRKLRNLNAANNRITEIPEAFWQLTQMDTLILMDNRLNNISSQIGNLQNLKMLNLHANRLTSFPVPSQHMRDLLFLGLASNVLTSIEGLERMPNLTHLYLNNNLITSLSGDVLLALSSLEYLSLPGNRLSGLPSQIGALTNLRTLDLGSNQILQLPGQIKFLTNLESLFVYNNSLKTFPEEIGSLNSLIELYANNNQIEKLPLTFRNFTALKHLSLNNNELLIPGNFGMIGFLVNLRTLDLRSNPMTLVVQAICDLTNTGTDVLMDEDVSCFGG